MVRRRNPLFMPGTGISLPNLAIDWLHALSLGVFRFWLGSVFWALIRADAWAIDVPLANRLDASVAQLNDELGLWYKAEEAQGRLHTRVQRLKPSMLGPSGSPEMATFGAQTNGLVLFAVSVLDTRGHKLGTQARLVRRGQNTLVGILGLIREYRGRMPPAAIQRFCDFAVDHVIVCKELGVAMKPKHHQMLEMGARLCLRTTQPRGSTSH